MTAEHYRDLLLKQWRIIALCAFLVGVGLGIGNLLVPPLYESIATVEVVIPSANAALLITGVDPLIQTEMTLATSQPILSGVVGHYPGLSVTQLREEVSTQELTNTNLFRVIVEDHNSTQAASLANALASALVEQQKAATQQANLQSQQPLKDALTNTQNQIDTTTAQINQLQSQKPPDTQQIQALQNTLNNLQTQFTQETQALASLQSDEAKKASYLTVADPAQASTSSVRSYLLPLSIAGGLVLGLLLGMLFVLLRAWLDQRIRSPGALAELLRWPILAEIGMQALDERQGAAGEEEEEVAPYEALNQRLAFLGIDRPLFSLLVTDASPEERGAGIVTGDLAIFLSRHGKKTLVVDANFSRPSQDRRFGTPAKPGLSNAILAFKHPDEESESFEHYLYWAGVAPLPGLRITPVGSIPPNPRQLLESQAMQHVFEALRACGAEVVVFAGPPVSRSSGVGALGALVDGVIVVVELARARKDKLLRMKALLAESGAAVLGCVVSEGPLPSSPARRKQGSSRGAGDEGYDGARAAEEPEGATRAAPPKRPSSGLLNHPESPLSAREDTFRHS